MIKNLETYINEDYFSKLASRKDNGEVRKENEIEKIEDLVMSYYDEDLVDAVSKSMISVRLENGKTIVDFDGDFFLREDVEKIPFQFGIVSKTFSCENCKKLESLKGCPEFVGKNFVCDGCKSLTSLEGCPGEVGWSFYCRECGRKFTEDEVKSFCKIQTKIFV